MTGSETTNTLPLRKGRIGGLDTLRGLALLAMAHYHFTWDLELFGYLDPGTATSGWLRIYARAIASTFLFLAGFSLFLAHAKGIQWQSFGKRLGMICLAAVAISIGTGIAIPEAPIYFGILHNIAASSLVGLLFIRANVFVTFIAAIAALAAPHFLTSDMFSSPFLYWLGLMPVPPRSNDYVPLLPWVGAFLLGMSAAKIALPRGWLDPFRSPSHKKNIVATAGRHSLMFYLLHQPILIGCVYLASQLFPPAPVDPVENYKATCESSCISTNNDAALCGRFCGCTLELLQSRSLFDPMIARNLTSDQQNEIGEVAQECRMIAN
jgi:uncharacterized membrane protein